MNAIFASAESRTTTYVKTIGCLVPPVVLGMFCVVFVLPKLKQLCRDTGFADETLLGFLGAADFFARHGVLMAVGVLTLVAMLEWRSQVRWPRCRRVSIGLLVFLTNTVIMALLFFMLCTAVVLAGGLVKPR